MQGLDQLVAAFGRTAKLSGPAAQTAPAALTERRQQVQMMLHTPELSICMQMYMLLSLHQCLNYIHMLPG